VSLRFFGRFVLRIFAQVAVRARLIDFRGDVASTAGFQIAQLLREPVEAFLG
jgi:hypothetical protein